MNNIRSTQRLNDEELSRIAKHGEAATRGSWHDEFSSSAVIYIGGLDPRLTEGDVLAIFSQYGEILDIHLPKFSGKPSMADVNSAALDDPSGEKRERLEREAKEKRGKRRGFGFLLFEDQRSTVLAVDNLNGSQVVGRTLRVDHVKEYKHLERDEESGKMKEREQLRMNARPQLEGASGSGSGSGAIASSSKTRRASSSSSSADNPSPPPMPEIDLEDPMAGYLAQQRKRRIADGSDDDDDDDDRRPRSDAVRKAEKEAKRQRKEERARIREEREMRRRAKEGAGSGAREGGERRVSRSRSRSPPPRRDDERRRRDYDDDERRRKGHSRPRDDDYDRRRPRY